MNQETDALLRDVAGRLERAVRGRDCPAIVALQGDRTLVLSDYDYLRDEATAAAFEARAAGTTRELHVVRWAFAVPQVWVLTGGELLTRRVSNHPLRDGEEEGLVWMSYDAEDGVDYGIIPYVRRPDGEPVFDDAEMFLVPVRPTERTPGYRLLIETQQSGD